MKKKIEETIHGNLATLPNHCGQARMLKNLRRSPHVTPVNNEIMVCTPKQATVSMSHTGSFAKKHSISLYDSKPHEAHPIVSLICLQDRGRRGMCFGNHEAPAGHWGSNSHWGQVVRGGK